MSRFIRLITAVGLVGVFVAAFWPGSASAHERRPVGTYTFVVGFATEPAIQNQPNGLALTITDAKGNPVEGAEKTLTSTVAYRGGSAKEFPLRAVFGQKGQYTADLIPTKAGAYTFTFTGTLNGDPINETFESGPGRFNDVESPAALQFPETVPAAADLAQQAQSAQATADTALQRATLFGLGGIAVGLVGLTIGVIALVTRARPAGDDAPSEVITAG